MTFLEVLLMLGLFLIIWGGGYIAGRYGKAWKIAEQPVIGEIIIDGEDIYLELYERQFRETLESHRKVTVDVAKIAEKTQPIAE